MFLLLSLLYILGAVLMYSSMKNSIAVVTAKQKLAYAVAWPFAVIAGLLTRYIMGKK